jgi:hypothetical protein
LQRFDEEQLRERINTAIVYGLWLTTDVDAGCNLAPVLKERVPLDDLQRAAYPE